MALKRLQPHKRGGMLYIFLLAAAVAAMVSIRQCSAPRIGPKIDAVAGGDTLNVAIEVSPMGVTLRGDTLTGPYYEMVRGVSEFYGRPIKYHPFTRLSDALEWLREGRCRLVVADIPVTADLNEKYIFVDPGRVDRLVLLQRRNSAGDITVKTQTDLANLTVWVPKGSQSVMRIHNLAHEIGDTIIVREDPQYGAEELGMLVALGELPGGLTVVSRTVADSLTRRYPSLDASVGISFNQYRGWAMMPADSLLRDSITEALRQPRN